VPAGYPHFAHRRCLDADDRLGPDALASAQLQFTALADKLPACLHRDALRLASRIADSLPELRVQVSEMILEIDGAKLIAQWRMGIEEVIQSTKDDDLPARLAKLVGGVPDMPEPTEWMATKEAPHWPIASASSAASERSPPG
jgi:hypothetical protein